jgi:hypothetical protein
MVILWFTFANRKITKVICTFTLPVTTSPRASLRLREENNKQKKIELHPHNEKA